MQSPSKLIRTPRKHPQCRFPCQAGAVDALVSALGKETPMGNSSASHPETFTSLETSPALVTAFGLWGRLLGPAEVSPLPLLELQCIPTPGRLLLLPRHHWKGALTAHAAQIPVPTQRLVFLVTHCHPFRCVTLSSLSASRAEDSSLLHDAAVMTAPMTTVASQLLPRPPRPLHPMACPAPLCSAPGRVMLSLPRCCQSCSSSAATLHNTRCFDTDLRFDSCCCFSRAPFT